MSVKTLSPEMAEKYAGSAWVRTYQNSDGTEAYIANRLEVYQMPDAVYLDLIGARRFRKYEGRDGHPPVAKHEKQQIWVDIDIQNGEVLRWWYVDARLQLLNEPWLDLNEILMLPPSHWNATLRSRFPSAVPSVWFI